MIKIAVLGSGSKGNSIYVEVDGVRFLVDCGFTKKELTKRLKGIGRTVEDIKFLLTTHNHGDHCAPWAREKFSNPPVWGQPVWLKSFELSHDEPCTGYTITDNDGNKIAIVSDTGCVSEEALANLFDCSAILVESNYDIDLLVTGKYPTELQERVASNIGHLRNECAAEVIEMVAGPGLKYIVALHLSEANNNPELVRFCLESVKPDGCEVVVSTQKHATKMLVII